MEKSLRARAVDLLSRREYTRRELERRLAPFAESPEQLTALLDELAERSWQSDQRFAQQFADSKGQRYGSRRLQQEMRQRGVDAELIRDALQGRDDLAAAQAQWLKKFGRMPDTPQERARQIRFLAGRGFPMSVIGKVLSGVDDDDFPADED
ncbi:recombination regulator RecX [Chromobacterium haemolyticum]|uniref:recombination regulator RecX n=1 Tax=Chromobacterium haemolyticum TaxID=394935 RepID=UPI0009DB389F|nr:recombination regulator RecX [Chromobacterium haemolyticum]OQS32132.1 recombination regulator RecX [Chromobacterium haemolyticum]PTU68866.1 recombination regulator RecX [Chromobacterium haemolyticum]